jgi:hypothetical protein
MRNESGMVSFAAATTQLVARSEQTPTCHDFVRHPVGGHRGIVGAEGQ